ncbi:MULTISPECIES: 1-acylglycerol-3-phosphate O-acyltransferase [Shewanella]|uniref:1-acyl-sn-glycerol-3-phosphate acyltransferase n=1 Tax=Shewanella fidelis TaxID=173509 RepID=A0AAW8NHM9_9GAMM|nr:MULTISPECIES: 1-acylglycerol-3-phosphate O-acyltransferase [Shewanella]MDR8522205.1 1-acylglycerol-3-phosphate O-acyltransferase [Shewanella fidelis]MDW4812579.1 1-acylglycerol-3-phosphate O-acyltransferase [Shewanella fidelis]MDW4816327.1 1-acylglycerol-3-phosphate O-acyltransferase [Shewanella fidelis]MDW4820820.1 1-acylglycerol-3-phosphate O-acyltransferase [Shewanella fidelis]MDW4825043.1 1-acylglycerol-3-phosphate O-acyltransferase [Shewanella fidelis]
MLLILRCLILSVMLILAFFIGGLACILRPRHRDNVHMFAKVFSWAAPVLGIKVIVRNAEKQSDKPCIFLANHQNNYDMFTHTAIVPKGTVSLGKKSLAWMPLFGQIYWLSGNILIDRKNRSKAFDTMAATARKIKEKCLSVWIFPEGTRSRGKGLLPFKAGAFYTAIAAGVPMVPVLASNQGHIKLNRWNNGVVIIEMMDPIDTAGIDKTQVKELSKRIHTMMAEKLSQLNQEASALMAKAV